MSERLDGFLAHNGLGTRSEARDLVRSGQVTVDGAVCRDAARHIVDQVVELNGTVVRRVPEAVTLLMHKPLGYACSRDPREAPLLDELVPELWQPLAPEPAGRLDRDTSGLIVVTSDGELIHTLTNPRKKLRKRYRVTYRGRLSSHAVERCAKGIQLDGDPRPTLPAKLVLEDASDDGDRLRATLWLSEGRYHQVRRMIAALGGEVVALHRDRIGALDLPADLAVGACRELSDRDRALLLTVEEPSLIL